MFLKVEYRGHECYFLLHDKFTHMTSRTFGEQNIGALLIEFTTKHTRNRKSSLTLCKGHCPVDNLGIWPVGCEQDF